MFDDIEKYLSQMGWGFEKSPEGVLTAHPGKKEGEGGAPSVINILPVEASQSPTPEAASALAALRDTYKGLILIYEDRWKGPEGELTRRRLAAHLGRYRSIFARKCEIRRVGADDIKDFLNTNHSYGWSKCKYKYAMYFKGEMVAAATFAHCRKMTGRPGTDAPIRSFEWVTYASLPDCRISGGMGRMLAAFIDEVNPDEVMSYSDNEWSDGAVYRRLGFYKGGEVPPVSFVLDRESMVRTHVSRFGRDRSYREKTPAGEVFYNPGSVKWLLSVPKATSEDL